MKLLEHGGPSYQRQSLQFAGNGADIEHASSESIFELAFNKQNRSDFNGLTAGMTLYGLFYLASEDLNNFSGCLATVVRYRQLPM
jgi:hypothetical protein